jgi:hypothetical protein
MFRFKQSSLLVVLSLVLPPVFLFLFVGGPPKLFCPGHTSPYSLVSQVVFHAARFWGGRKRFSPRCVGGEGDAFLNSDVGPVGDISAGLRSESCVPLDRAVCGVNDLVVEGCGC